MCQSLNITYFILQPGCIEKFRLDTSSIINQVAQNAEIKGHFEDAAALFDLAGVSNHLVSISFLSK